MLETTVIDNNNLAATLPEAPQASSQALPTVCVVGLGYVGLPVAVEFGKQRPTVGYDLSARKVHNLRRHHDATGEVSTEELQAARFLDVTDEAERIKLADFVIVDGDPLADIKSVLKLTTVIKNGQVYSLRELLQGNTAATPTTDR